jgi:WD40 repeat protein
VWDLDSLSLLSVFDSPTDKPTKLVHHPSAYVIAVAFVSGYLRVFDVAKLAIAYEVRHHSGAITSLAITKDAKYAITGSTDGTLCIYDALREYTPLRSARVGPVGAAVNFAVSGDCKSVAVVDSSSSLVRLFDVLPLECVDTLDVGNATGLLHVLFAPPPNTLLASSGNMLFQLDTHRRRLVGKTPLNTAVTSIAASPHIDHVLTSGHDGLLRVWLFQGLRTEQQRFAAHASAAAFVNLGPDSTSVVSGGDATIVVWKYVRDADDDVARYVDHVTATRVPQAAAPSGSNAQIRADMVASVTEALRDRFRALDTLDSAPMSPAAYDGMHSAVDSRMRQYSRDDASVNLELRSCVGFGTKQPQYAVAFGEGFAAVVGLGAVLFADGKTTVLPVSDAAQLTTLASSPSRRLLAAASTEGGPIFVWELVEGAPLLRHHFSIKASGIAHLAFSNDNRHLLSVVAELDPSLVIWSVETGAIIATSLPLDFPINAIAFFQTDPAEFVSGGRGVTFWCHSASGIACEHDPNSARDAVGTVATSPSGLVAAGTDAGHLLLYRCSRDKNELVKRVEAHRGAVAAVLFTNSRFLSAGPDGVALRELEALTVMYIFTLDSSPTALLTLADGSNLTCAEDGCVRELTPALRVRAALHSANLTAVAINSLSSFVASADARGGLTTSTIPGLSFLHRAQFDSKVPTAMSFAITGNSIFVGFHDGTIGLVPITSSSPTDSILRIADTPITSVVACDADVALVSTAGPRLFAVDVSRGIVANVELAADLAGAAVCSIARLGGERTFVVAFDDGHLIVLSLDHNLSAHPLHSASVRNSSVCKELHAPSPPPPPPQRSAVFVQWASATTFVCGVEESLVVFDLSKGKLVKEYAVGDFVTAVDVSPDGEYIAAGCQSKAMPPPLRVDIPGGMVSVIVKATGAKLLTGGHCGAVRHVAFSSSDSL